jgi:predicted restriction endonuclease
VLTSYNHRCALTGLAVPQLLNASHIIPWAAPESEHRRADPTNGLCLNALHDRAFDRGLITFDEDHRLVVSPHLAERVESEHTAEDDDPGPLIHRLLTTAGSPLHLPERFAPDPEALDYHREHVFSDM